MRRIALMNQKGGVGKTTTTVNLAAALARLGKRTLVVDIDPQAHSTTHFGVEQRPAEPTLHEILTKSMPVRSVVKEVETNLHLIPSSIDLAGAEMELSGVVGRELILRDRLQEEQSKYEFVLMDCPPSLGVLTINALTAANEVFVPLQPHFLALHGLSKLFETVQLVSKRLNPELRITGVVVCLYETSTRLSAEVLADLEEFLTASKSRSIETPWSKADIFSSKIRRNIKLAEAASFGKSVFDYDAACHGAKDYAALAAEVVGAAATLRRPTVRQSA